MIKFYIVFTSLWCIACTANHPHHALFDHADKPLSINAEIFEPAGGVRHTSPRPFGSYLSMNLPFSPLADVRAQTETLTGDVLRHRGEAHITSITPPEFAQVLKEFVSIEAIHDIADEMELQHSAFEVICLGRGQVVQGQQTLSTYYIVVASAELLAIRMRIHEVFVAAGGDPEVFRPEVFFPHITVGFTQRDLHASDGVIKDETSCIAPIVVATD